ncbi:multidrug effflux MFS transporter [Leucobacter luti]|uniref:multidrug effflux MFS transporter n=1 Tax=Leucobacter luti TaxID=340320 RepID=UPI003D080618
MQRRPRDERETTTVVRRVRLRGAGLIVLLGVLEAFGPLSMDLYMPKLPELAESLRTSDALAQSTMSVCMIGLALGQLVAGPLSDRFGRRPPLLIGVAAFTVFSIASALAPTIGWLILFRFLQGLGGSAGMVVSLAIARDLYSGTELSRMLSWLALVGATAPIVAPMIGGLLAGFLEWRGYFAILAGIGILLLAVTFIALPETRRFGAAAGSGAGSGSGAAASPAPGGFFADARVLLDGGFFRLLLAISAISGISFFSYLSMSSFVLQEGFGFSPQLFGIVFAAGSICNVLGSQTSRVLVTRFGTRRLYGAGIGIGLVGAAVVLAGALLGWGVGIVLAGLWIYLASTGFTLPNGNSLALSEHGERAGTAAAMLGTASLIVGPIAAPIISLGGITAFTLGATMFSAMLVCVVLARVALKRMA